MKVAVTRPGEEEDDRLSVLLREAGAVPVIFSLLRIAGPPEPEALRRELADFLQETGRRRWILFTSRNAIPPFLEALSAAGGSLRELAGSEIDPIRVAAVGSATARVLSETGVQVALVPDRFTGDELLEAVLEAEGAGGSGGAGSLEGVDVLLPRAERAREVLPAGLRERGARVRIPVAYRVLPDAAEGRRLVRAVLAGEVDVVTLTSGSAAEVLAGALGSAREEDPGLEWPDAVRVAVLGPVTARACRERGLRVDLVPIEATLPAFARAIAELGG